MNKYKNLNIINFLRSNNINCFPINRINLDNELLEPYDEGEKLISNTFETETNLNLFIDIKQNSNNTMFKYFLDGSRYTYKIADMLTHDNDYVPVISAQVGAALCSRDNSTKKMKTDILCRKNYIAFYHTINNAVFRRIKDYMKNISSNGVTFEAIKYIPNTKISKERPENAAISKILREMHNLELDVLKKVSQENKLNDKEMLILDGPLQFIENVDDRIFNYVIGVSKQFNPNQVIKMDLKTNIHIGSVLHKLEFGQRTPVIKYEIPSVNRVIGIWYLRIRNKEKMKNPHDGIIKIEKVAITSKERESGFDSDLINRISQSLVCERNFTCYGDDDRWTTHLYPVYLTEKVLKSSFINQDIFMNLF
mgnify:CR=1 FL=1